MKRIPYKTDQNHPVIKAYVEAVKKGLRSHHVVLVGKKWAIKKAGDLKPSHIFSTQEEATKYAYNLAKNRGTSLFIHGSDGRIKTRVYC